MDLVSLFAMINSVKYPNNASNNNNINNNNNNIISYEWMNEYKHLNIYILIQFNDHS